MFIMDDCHGSQGRHNCRGIHTMTPRVPCTTTCRRIDPSFRRDCEWAGPHVSASRFAVNN
jgi:hypothetical protein